MERREVRIELTDVPRFNAKPPRFTPRERKAFDEWFRKAVAHDWIRPSQSRHSSGFIFVPKKNGRDLRPCIDYRKLNEITKSRVYAPLADRFLRSLICKHTWYTKIDLTDAFYHLRIWEPDKWKTAFRTPHGLYESNVPMFGLKNAPGEFQLWIEMILAPTLGDNVCIHIDDILIHTDTEQECIILEKRIRDLLSNNNVHINEDKSVSLVREVEYCGHVFNKTGFRPVDKSDEITTWPTPKNQTQLRSFLGLTNCFRDHVPRYGTIAAPLYKCTGTSWLWTSQQDDAFRKLKAACKDHMTTRNHDPTAKATITTDASEYGIGAILSQRGVVTAIWSRALTPAERNYTTNERELLAVVSALKVWVFHLDQSPGILVRTDNMINSLQLKPNNTNRRLNRWINELQVWPLVWTHIPGEENPADAPSRRPDYKYIKGGEGP
jgi:hypothetical protein